jgi:hypothetical protein
MTTNHAFETVQQLGKMLLNLDHCLDKAVEYAKSRPFEVDTLVGARLAPDQFPLARQVQSSCDTVKFAAAYLANKEAPSHPDTETTVAELKERIATTRRYLETFKAEDFAGYEERRVAPKWLKGKWFRGDDYLAQVATPNAYFHVTTAYAILRHNGVPVGKQDYLGSAPVRD